MSVSVISELSGFPAWTTLGLGFALGLRHALDADHLAAVSTFVSQERSLWRSSLVGAFWGLGHTAALLVFGVAIAAFRLAIPQRLSLLLELAVGCMLVLLGARALASLPRLRTVHNHPHEHGRFAHAHLHTHTANHSHAHRHHTFRLGGRPFVVGVVHGLAGTAALMLVVVGAIPSVILAVFYILVFGLGSIAGMMIMSLIMGLPLALLARRLALAERLIRLTAGLFSVGLGLFLLWDVGSVHLALGIEAGRR